MFLKSILFNSNKNLFTFFVLNEMLILTRLDCVFKNINYCLLEISQQNAK